MPVTSVTTKLGSTAGDTTDDGIVFQWTRRITKAVVCTSDTTDDEILGNNQVPKSLDPHEASPWLRVKTRGLRRTSPVYAEVDIDYDTPRISGPSGGGPGGTPLDMQPKIVFDSIITEEDVDTDVDGEAIRMKTFERFNPPPRVRKATPVIRISRNVTWINPQVISNYRLAVNSDEFLTMPPGTLQITALRAEQDNSDVENPYWRIEAEIQIRRAAPGSTDAKAWYLRLLAQGFTINIPANQSITGTDVVGLKAFSNGRPVDSPVPHDKDTGYRSAAGDPATWYEFEIFPSLEYAALGLL